MSEKKAHQDFDPSREIPEHMPPQPELMEVPLGETEEGAPPPPMTPEDIDRIADEIWRDQNKPEEPMIN